MDKIAVLIPCYNESKTIEKVVTDFKRVLPEAVIYVYDNNSTDHTDEIARKAGAVVRYEHRQGKGNVIRRMFRENKRPFHNFGNSLVRKSINLLFNTDIKDIMTGYRAFSYQFVKSFPVLSKGFEIETEMSIHAADKNMFVENVIIEYRDRPEGSVSKLNTYSDGFRVLRTIARLYRTYKPMNFYGVVAAVLAVLSVGFLIPILVKYSQTHLVPNFPTLFVCGFVMLAAIQSFFSGMILQTISQKNRQDFEMELQHINDSKEEKMEK